MIEDARTYEDGRVLECDVCVIGSGAAGVTVARRLMAEGQRVVLLAGGGPERDSTMQALYAASMSGVGDFRPENTRRRQHGGSTMHWAGFCLPLSPEDFEPRDWIPYSGWPIRYADLVPYYRRAQLDVELADFVYGTPELAALRGQEPLDVAGGAIESVSYHFSPPSRFATLYEEELAASGSPTLLWAHLTELVLEPGLDSVERASCAVLGGPTFQVEADRFVLACGGIDNARLLLASNRQMEPGIGNGHDLVGRFFMEHPHFYRGAVWIAPSDLDTSFYRLRRVSLPLPDGGDRSVQVQGALALSAAIREAEGLPGFAATFGARDFDGVDVDPLDPERALSVLAHHEEVGLHALDCRVEQTPDPDSRVTLRGDTDALGIPQADLHWKIRDEDLATLARGLELIGTELGARQLGRLWRSVDADGRFDWELENGSHHMGTTRMAARPEDGVVDADCRVFGVDNLYVAGSSVFTTGGHANPTLTIVALAQRLADHLLGRPYEPAEEP
ncbi:MAG: GMC family oxidoreductase [Myxococcota bacterium]|nr:GMC family oxidoreductase [Myxococcota bacterium]